MSLRFARLAVPLLLAIGVAQAAPMPQYITAAVANPDRPDTDRMRDEARKPAESVAFTGLKPGQVVVDFIPGGGYFSRIFSGIVGPQGRVYAVDPAELVLRGPPPRKAAPDERAPPKVPQTTDGAVLSQYFTNQFDPNHHFANVTFLVESAQAVSVPEPADLVWTSRNYHDLHNPAFGSPDMLKLDKSIYETLKPGGIFLVLDHSTAPGMGFTQTNTLHRSDPEAVIKEVEQAGFKLIGRSYILANPADDHTLAAFAMKDHSDQYILKFQRPE